MLARLASFLLLVALLNVTALSSGLTSITRSGSGDMAGMNMGSPSSGSHDRQAPADEGCRFPWSSGCTSFSPCAPVALLSAATCSTTAAVMHRPPTVLVERVPESTDLPPDHPPPRA